MRQLAEHVNNGSSDVWIGDHYVDGFPVVTLIPMSAQPTRVFVSGVARVYGTCSRFVPIPALEVDVEVCVDSDGFVPGSYDPGVGS